jgi:hypothetical protein
MSELDWEIVQAIMSTVKKNIGKAAEKSPRMSNRLCNVIE